METASKIFTLLATVFLVELVAYNFLFPDKLPKIPGDLYLGKFGIRLYVPFVSALGLSVILAVTYFQFFAK